MKLLCIVYLMVNGTTNPVSVEFDSKPKAAAFAKAAIASTDLVSIKMECKK